MRFVVLALLLALAYWYSVRVGMRVGSASVGTVLVGGVALRLVVSLLSTHGDLIGNTADPTTYEVGSGYLSAGWRRRQGIRVGACAPASHRGRPRQCRLLVSPRRQKDG